MKLRKIVCISISFIFITSILVSLSSINLYAGNDTVKFGLQAYRKVNKEGNQFSYQINGHMLWKPVKYENDGSTYTYNDTVYCLKADKGFYRNKPGVYTQDYDRSYDYKEYKNLSMDLEQYVSVLWILNHAYIPNTETSESEKEDLLAKIGLYSEDLTEDEIDIAQQLAIWYFTNQTEEENADTYHIEEKGVPSLPKVTTALKNDIITTSYETMEETKKKNLEKLFIYLVDNAKRAEQNAELAEEIELIDTQVEAINKGNQYIVGPYQIKQKEEQEVNLELQVLDQNNQILNATYYSVNDKQEPTIEQTDVNELIGKTFYIAIPLTEDEITNISVNLLGKYKENKITYWTKNGDSTVQPLVTIERVDHNINILKKVELPKIESNYHIELISMDYDNEELKLSGTKYQVTKPDGSITVVTTDENGSVEAGDLSITEEGTVTYYIQELEASNGYVKNEEPVQLTITTRAKNGKYVVDSHQVEGNAQSELKNNQLYVITKSKQFDFSLRFFVSQVGGTKINREPQTDITQLNKVEKNKKVTTATYEHSKAPVTVGANDVITYTVRVYNEGNVGGYADEITFYLPPELEMINDLTNYPEETNFNAGYRWRIVSGDIRKIKSNYLAYSANEFDQEKNDKNKLVAFENGKLSYQEIQVKCKIKAGVTTKSKITSFMQITKASDEKGNRIVDRDSIPDAEFILPVDEELASYKEQDIIQNARQVKGQEDDDDFEQIVMQDFDLSMRQWITQINSKKVTGREPNIDFSNLTTRTETTAIYNQTKQMLDVKRGDTITYTIRVYNEGDVDGYASRITSYLPDALVLVEDDEINQKYQWKTSEDGRIITTEYLADHKIHCFEGNALSSEEIQVVCKVEDIAKIESYLTVLTEIAECKDEQGNIIVDRDSTVHNLNVPDDMNLEYYQKDEIERNTPYIPGEEDDTDFEKVRIVYFKLAIKQFTTKVNDTDIVNRIPKISIKENQKIEYQKVTDPIAVENNNSIINNIRIYNEGLIDGYASKIVYQLGEEVIFDPNEAVNQKYGWKMYQEARVDQMISGKEGAIFTYANKNYIETQNPEEAKLLVTEILSKENGEVSNKIKARDLLKLDSLDYRDIQIAFIIKQKENGTDSQIKNTVTLAEVKDENNDIPENKNTKLNMSEMLEEQMQDTEYAKIKTFDLAIYKELQSISVLANGITREEKYEERKDIFNEVKLKMTDFSSSAVTLRYTIRIKNEGEIPGYITEVQEILPKGYQTSEDNTNWKIEASGEDIILKTEAFSDKILEPGESIEIPLVLKWNYDSWNMGKNTSVTKILKTKNSSNTVEKNIENNQVNYSIYFSLGQEKKWDRD